MRQVLIALIGLLSVAAAGFAAGEKEAPAQRPTVEIEHELGTTAVPKSPENVVTFGYDMLDTLDSLGVEVAGLPKPTTPQYLSKFTGDRYTSVGSLFEPDFETIFEIDPDAIFISARQSSMYEQFAEIAPTIYLATDTDSYVASVKDNTRTVASLFDVPEAGEDALAELDRAVEELRSNVSSIEGEALFLMVNEGELSVYGPGSRFGYVYSDFGFTPVDSDTDASTHGQSISFEFLAETDPDILLVMDRGAAIGRESTAETVLNNGIIQGVSAIENDRIIHLTGEAWYLAAGGLTATMTMIEDLTAGLQ